MTVRVEQGDALNLTTVEDESVDLVVTSPPYFALRVYKDSGEVLAAVGNEDSPEGYLKALDRFMEEMWRVLKPSGSVFVVLGDKFAGSGGHNNSNITDDADRGPKSYNKEAGGIRPKSLMGLPWRFAIRQIDAGWILRQELIWSKPNGMPESVRDRCRRSHEQIFHFAKQGDYYAAVLNPLGALPPSVWSITTSGLRIPKEVIVMFQADKHYAAYPPELVKRIVEGWSPEKICTICGRGRVIVYRKVGVGATAKREISKFNNGQYFPEGYFPSSQNVDEFQRKVVRIPESEKCACPTTDAPTIPAVVLDPFGGVGTTALVASLLNRDAITIDLSAGYTRLAAWRLFISDHGPKLQSKWAKQAKAAE